ncbi:uncharacterized protein K02A2.6-like [Stylophora pistillata]|uniref:uncharacterized protein K02A2.6-like n=1 Tax=Stylophora pistillata TaxID=50429 RepID=UPI000C046241|nr:uncharacterized protein K02A2.6-like [Stylophora pistillata]
MDDATETTVKNCQACVVNQPLNKYTSLQPTISPCGPWVKGAVDLVGPINGKSSLTYIDYYLSYTEAFILQEVTSPEVIKALKDIFARFGFPEEIVSDNGKQFVSAEFEAVRIHARIFRAPTLKLLNSCPRLEYTTTYYCSPANFLCGKCLK